MAKGNSLKVDHVVLLHGLGRSSDIMEKMGQYLHIHGYFPHNIAYHSTAHAIETLSEVVYQKIRALTTQPRYTVHFVGHSMGAIIIRRLLQQHTIDNLGRVVMLGPPNQGSDVAEFLKRFDFYRKRYGKSGCQLGTKANKFLTSLPKATYPCGIIAGDKSQLIDKPFAWFLMTDRDNDGKVTVENTELEGMADHIVVPVTHPNLPKNGEVMHQTAFFLAHGYFEKADD